MDNKKRKTAISAICVLSAAVIALAALSIWQRSELDRAERVNEIYGEHALSQLENSLYGMDSALKKSLYATDAALVSQLCAEAAASGEGAIAALRSLPCVTYELERLAGSVNTAGDYAMAVSRLASRGSLPDERSRADLAALSEGMSALAGEAARIREALADNALKLDEYADGADCGRTDTVGYELREVEAALPELMSLNYDGRYASKEEGESAESVGEAAARKTAAAFLSLPEQRLISRGMSAGPRPVWWFAVSVPGGEEQRIGVDARTGEVAEWSDCRLPTGGELTDEEAERAAADFLAARGLENLELTDVRSEGGLSLARFAEKAGEALRLTSGVSVAVNRESGEVCAYTAVKNGPPPEDVSPEIGPERAAETLPDSLQTTSARLVTVKSAGGGTEKLCWELNCQAEDGSAVAVYVDAKTGAQEKIEISGT